MVLHVAMMATIDYHVATVATTTTGHLMAFDIALTLTALGLMGILLIPVTAVADLIHSHTYRGDK